MATLLSGMKRSFLLQYHMDNNKNVFTTIIKLNCLRIVSDGENKPKASNTEGVIHPSFSQPGSKVTQNTTRMSSFLVRDRTKTGVTQSRSKKLSLKQYSGDHEQRF